MKEAPTLETDRLTLRAHRAEDFAESSAMWRDPLVTRFIGGKASSEQESWFRLLRYAGHWLLLGFGYWVIEEKSSGQFVGELGFADFKRELEPSVHGVPELGWALASPFHGKGYATEALRAAIGWGDTRFCGAKTICIIAPTHAASLRVATKCGYRESHRADHRGEPVIVLSR